MAPENSPRTPGPMLFGFTNLRRLRQEGTRIFTHGKGVFAYDDQGKDYLEATATFYCLSLGFGDEELIETATAQMHRLSMYPSGMYRTSDIAFELAQRLAQISPIPDTHVMFATTGSEANDHAVKSLWFANLARGQGKRRKIISRRGSYHGSTVTTAALGGSAAQQAAYGIPTQDCLYVSQPNWPLAASAHEDEEAYTDALASELSACIESAGPETIAAFFAEPVSASAGVAIPPKDYFPKVQAILDQHGIPLLADEVVTGFGRTGSLWGSETLRIRPDFITCAKGFSSAYQPISALLLSKAFYNLLEEACDKVGVFHHGLTYAAHPVAAAVALKVMDIMERRHVLAHVQRILPGWQRRLQALQDHPLVSSTRHAGLLAAVEIARPHDAGSRQDEAFLTPRDLTEHLYAACLDAGLIVRALGSCVVLCPPLTITEAETDELFARLCRALDSVLSTHS
ncbi:MAG: aminotransferase class III-fold pyridoxal phosphate-dependent enzyme [Lautropia sp.]|nr:aminotransferase class III-fold pyridoxal phosphate-dependent enzyme [Lautropia sp.]